MKKTFEELEIWKLSFDLAKEIGRIFYDSAFRNYGFQDQIMRATISISNNIAEGNDRGSIKDFVKFLIIARASGAEVRNMMYLAYEFGYITQEQQTVYVQQLTTISIKISNLIAYLRGKLPS